MTENKAPETTATLGSLIDLQVSVDKRVYHLLIPNGVPHEEAEWVCKEMAGLIGQMKEKAAAEKKAQTGAIDPQLLKSTPAI